MQGQRKADLIASNVSSIVATYAKAYNSYSSKAVIFPDRVNNTSTTLGLGHVFVNGHWPGQNVSSFCLESSHSALWKDPDWLGGPIQACWRKIAAEP